MSPVTPPPGFRELRPGEIVDWSDWLMMSGTMYCLRELGAGNSVGKPYDPSDHWLGRYRKIPTDMPHEEA